jgi:hypothetical protein
MDMNRVLRSIQVPADKLAAVSARAEELLRLIRMKMNHRGVNHASTAIAAQLALE